VVALPSRICWVTPQKDAANPTYHFTQSGNAPCRVSGHVQSPVFEISWCMGVPIIDLSWNKFFHHKNNGLIEEKPGSWTSLIFFIARIMQ